MEMNELRKVINQIDQEMMLLFKKRMAVSKQIGQYKVKNNLPIYDQTREESMIKAYETLFNDHELWPYYEKFMRHLMMLSKEIQK
jgi:chorismate mutase